MKSERLDIDRKIDLFMNKETTCRELQETFKSVEIQRRRFLKDIDNSMNRFKAKYGGYIQHAESTRRRSVHNISCSDSIGTFRQRNSVTGKDQVRHSIESGAVSQLSRRRNFAQPESINKQAQGKLLYRRRSTLTHNELGFRENYNTVSITMDRYNGASESPHSAAEKDGGDHQHDSTKEKYPVLDNRKIYTSSRDITRRHSEPECSEMRNDVDNKKVRHKSETAYRTQLLNLEDDKNEKDNIGNYNVVDSPSSRLSPTPDDIAKIKDGGENVETKKVQTNQNMSKWSRVKELTMKVQAEEKQEVSLFDVALNLCPKIEKRVEFRGQEISQKAVEKIKPKWHLLRRKSIIADQPSGPERVSVNDLETICPKLEDNELEMNTLKSLLNFRKGHKKIEIVARLLSDHIRTDTGPSFNLKEGAWAAALSSCRYLR
ncbi:hypothetical protein LOTGIDRAFT_157988 [Lottia gigantea]|uniref:Uncharacterized protein n=1 Tax=Lottia gigantea TaxID=225164 RepID=V4ATS1_LOTGI|nr:hypothetical protein LOTGIDRAFT_157988 [Lottia gigantea]ESP00698.1 hypothetical protein LOTGIDRAFT_157988 [Lottia gigantea]